MKNSASIRGQISLLFLLLAVPLILLIFSVSRIAVGVRNRINVQNAADAAALTAAEWQARGLNQIALANAGLAALGLLEKAVRAGRETESVKSARLAMLGAEAREFENIKTDVVRRIPEPLAAAATENARITLAGGAGDALVFGATGEWQYRFSPKGAFDPFENRILGLAWQKTGARYAFASAQALSKANGASGIILAPDFAASLSPVLFTAEAFGYMTRRPGMGFVRESMKELNEKILH